MTDGDLVRFLDIQSHVYEEVTKELAEGRKQTHWMWFIFPELAGLGHSSMARRYAIRDLNQARRYLAHPLLGDRLRHDVRLMMSHKDKLHWKSLVLPTISSFGLVSPCLPKRLPLAPIAVASARVRV